MNILSIQSHVAFGHVGNASAVFAMQRLGHEVWPIHTVQFSNHTGYGAWTGRVFDGQAVEEVVDGIADRGALERCDGVLSGYMGSADIGQAILSTVARARQARPAALYCCDPVIGDVGRGVFVRAGIPEFMRDRAVPAADVVTPNQFELEYLTGRTVATVGDARRAITTLKALGPGTVLVTSLRTDSTPSDAVDLLAEDREGAWLVRTPRLDVEVNGAGDAIAALFFVHLLETGSAGAALSRAAASVYGLLRRTAEAGSREILLVAAQEELVRPTWTFTAQPV
ncbi:pyridoxal kinase PdxY [Enterovirga sp.]|uniref:pyridoxal kinase PdxY n=1 Tax=Enterovirga sp. TaxID=2026350 RepID=UPI00262314ED|nr:pyridoxal kinase PdxY [Enterovirga sp.]MDB5590113.1 pyridoxamine kinase [Enterovirga sp.]